MPGVAGAGSAFRSHGTFVYDVGETVAQYGSNKKTIDAMKRAEMNHAWIRIHGTTPYSSTNKQKIAGFIADLKSAGIAVAGWGWCQGEDAVGDAKLALGELQNYGLADYIADIEHGHHGSVWTTDEIVNFCQNIRNGLSGSFGITTFPLIDWHEPKLMKAALPFVDMFNPQVYWFNYPNDKMVKEFKGPNGRSYMTNNPSEYAELCLDCWDRLLGGKSIDLVMTGAAYWGEGNTQDGAEKKLDAFLDGWGNFGRIIGLNWWHFGGTEGMSQYMLDRIAAAKLGVRNYKS